MLLEKESGLFILKKHLISVNRNIFQLEGSFGILTYDQQKYIINPAPRQWICWLTENILFKNLNDVEQHNDMLAFS